MRTINLRAEIQKSESGKVSARLIPYGVDINHHGETVRFERGGVRVPDAVIPITVDHGEGALERIGKATRVLEEADGLYADFEISDTSSGRDVLALLRDGVLTDVSAGVSMEEFGSGVLEGDLDHVAIVARGAFGEAGSKVLAVHAHDGGNKMDEEITIEETSPEVTELATEVENLRTVVAELSVPGAITEPMPFANKREFVLALAAASRGDTKAMEKIQKFVLADDTTTTAAGVVPDHISSEVIEIISEGRPFVQTLHQDDVGTSGMSVDFPRVVTPPSVAAQATQKTEVDSTAMAIDVVSVALATYAGASDVARQLVERSSPAFVDILFRHYADQYNRTTNAAAIAAAVAFADGTAVLADLSADAVATFAAVSVANTAIIAGVRQPATHWLLGTTRWAELNSLADTDGRPLLVFPDNGPMNAQGQSGFTAMAGQYHGLIAYLDPDAVATDSLIYNAPKLGGILETSPQQLRAEVVSLLGFEMGVYGLFAFAGHQDTAGYTFTLV